MRYMWPSESSPSRSLSIADGWPLMRHRGRREDILAGAQLARTGLRLSTSKLALVLGAPEVLGTSRTAGNETSWP
jgi:hypothetical protein